MYSGLLFLLWSKLSAEGKKKKTFPSLGVLSLCMEVYISTSQTLKKVGDSQRLEKGADFPFKEALGWSEAPIS